MPKKRLLITGASGFLGWNLCEVAKKEWTVLGTVFSHSVAILDITLLRVDLTKFERLKELFRQVKPDAVIHTAAVTDPDFCQQNRTFSHAINTEASINIAGLCSDLGIPCLFTSTDLVFNGLDPPYAEEDEPSPLSVYGEQKVLAECGMRDRYPSTVICRLPLMFGDPGPVARSFIQPLIQALKSGSEVNLFVDEFRTPVSGKDAAEGLMLALTQLPDIIHLGGAERISRYEFGQLLSKVLLRMPHAKLNPCRQKDLELPAPRPRDVSLDSSKAMALGFKPNALRAELENLRHVIDF
jgi:dTDP-4-dehydrorhamnose reductase